MSGYRESICCDSKTSYSTCFGSLQINQRMVWRVRIQPGIGPQQLQSFPFTRPCAMLGPTTPGGLEAFHARRLAVLGSEARGGRVRPWREIRRGILSTLFWKVPFLRFPPPPPAGFCRETKRKNILRGFPKQRHGHMYVCVYMHKKHYGAPVHLHGMHVCLCVCCSVHCALRLVSCVYM